MSNRQSRPIPKAILVEKNNGQVGNEQTNDNAPVHPRGVAAILHNALETFEQRQETYGANDIVFGNVLAAMFPEGITLNGAADFRMFLMFMHSVGKLSRLAGSGLRHADSAHDNIVYSGFLELLAETHNIKVG